MHCSFSLPLCTILQCTNAMLSQPAPPYHSTVNQCSALSACPYIPFYSAPMHCSFSLPLHTILQCTNAMLSQPAPPYHSTACMLHKQASLIQSQASLLFNSPKTTKQCIFLSPSFHAMLQPIRHRSSPHPSLVSFRLYHTTQAERDRSSPHSSLVSFRLYHTTQPERHRLSTHSSLVSLRLYHTTQPERDRSSTQRSGVWADTHRALGPACGCSAETAGAPNNTPQGERACVVANVVALYLSLLHVWVYCVLS